MFGEKDINNYIKICEERMLKILYYNFLFKLYT